MADLQKRGKKPGSGTGAGHRHSSREGEGVVPKAELHQPTPTKAREKVVNHTAHSAHAATIESNASASNSRTQGLKLPGAYPELRSATPPNKKRRQRVVDLDGNGNGRMASTDSDEVSIDSRHVSAARGGGGNHNTIPFGGGVAEEEADMVDEPDNFQAETKPAAEPRRRKISDDMQEAMENSLLEAKASKTSSHSRARTTTHDGAYGSSRHSRYPTAAAEASDAVSPLPPASQPNRSRRNRVSASVYEPSSEAAGADREEAPEDLRKRMEALKMEVGDSWLRVLAGQQSAAANSATAGSDVAATSGKKVSTESAKVAAAGTGGTSTNQPVVQVVRKGKKKKAVGEIQ